MFNLYLCMKMYLQKLNNFLHSETFRMRICARIRVHGYPRIPKRAAAAGHDVNPALGDPRGGSNAFRFCVSSATRESSQGQVVPRFRASLRHSGRALKIDSNQFYT